MRIRYVILIIMLVISVFVYLGYDSQKAYEACVKAHKQSNDTCRFYSF